MDNIIRLHRDAHRRVQELLPWYANGTLEAEEIALVDAHLADCSACRAELDDERALRHAIVDEPSDAQHGWDALRSQLLADRVRGYARPRPVGLLRRPVALGWALAAQAAVLVVTVATAEWLTRPSAPAYHALGSVVVAEPGNMIVIFRPTASEAALRSALQRQSARLVDGPTSAGAYVLRVDAAKRDVALRGLRNDANVAMAEPIDAGDTR